MRTKEAGCHVVVDPIGNIFARREGKHPDAAPVMLGSHLDTQPSGGKFDGIYGVMAALEIIRSMNDHGIETERPVEIVNWTNEEGSRFPRVMMGSAVYAGARGLGETLATVDHAGISVAEALEAIGYAGTADLRKRPLHAFLEAHIEQGPVLEQKGIPIGIVTGGYGLRWFDVAIKGQESHAGTTPMGLRQDALAGGAEIIRSLTKLAVSVTPEARITVGNLTIAPGSRNTIASDEMF
jgi:N-carbamoyl-L-amino-acid hydrolase